METYIATDQSPLSEAEKDELIEAARHHAVDVLHGCSHRLGFKASAKRTGYPQVWARDSMITLLGSLFSGDDDIVIAAKASHDTLRRWQTDRGLIPNYVDTRNKQSSFHIYADGGALYVIATAALFRHESDLEWLEEVWESIALTLDWYAYQDVDQSGMISIQEACDWKDLLAVRGKGLFINAILYMALRQASSLARKLGMRSKSTTYTRRATKLKRMMNQRLWYAGPETQPEQLFRMYHGEFRSDLEAENVRGTLERRVIPENERMPNERYYLPYIEHYGFGDWFDTLGNLFAVLGGIADKSKTADILDLIEHNGLTSRGPITAIYPSIKPGEKDWRDYYANFNLNMPDQYHNGGVWPMVGGFYVAALVKAGRMEQAHEQLAELASLNRLGIDSEWEFNEWYHGHSGQPKGKRGQAWSAGMYLFAHECVRRKRVPFF